MKTFIALAFIGILSYAYAQLVPIQECKKVNPMSGFSATNFFTGTWYVTHVKAKTSETVCQTFQTSKTPEGKYVTEFKYNKDGQENKVRCEASREEHAKKLHFTCERNGKREFELDFIVLSTDYSDYGVFYRCVSLKPNLKADNYLVVRRDAGNTEIPEAAKSLTAGLNLLKCSDITKA